MTLTPRGLTTIFIACLTKGPDNTECLKVVIKVRSGTVATTAVFMLNQRKADFQLGENIIEITICVHVCVCVCVCGMYIYLLTPDENRTHACTLLVTLSL